MQNPHVLLVEDDPKIVRALRPALEVSGHRVTVAADGTAALSELLSSDWDAFIVDLGLPDMDGKEVVRLVRQCSAAPVLVISARHGAADLRESMAAGANHFLSKPFASPELVAWLKDALPSGPLATA